MSYQAYIFNKFELISTSINFAPSSENFFAIPFPKPDAEPVIIAILFLGPKEFPVALKKIGSYFGKLKNTLSNFQREVNSVTENIDIF